MIDAVRKWLDEVKERCEKATPGPWCEYLPPINGGEENPDCQFMAAAREDIPRLLALVERLREYARHQDECPSAGYGKSGWAPHGEPCDCGFNRIWEGR